MKQRIDYQITQPDGSVVHCSITKDVVEPVMPWPLTITLSGVPEEKDTASFFLNAGDTYSIIDYEMLSALDRRLVESMLKTGRKDA